MGDRFRRLDETRFDVIVVGAGTGGLTAAALLGLRGLRVLVLDQHYVAGGNATVFRRRGYEFDIGVHYLGECHPGGVIPRVLAAAGVHDIVFEEMDPGGFDTLVYPDFTIRTPRGIANWRARLVEQFPGEVAGIDRYVQLLCELERAKGISIRAAAVVRSLPPSSLLAEWVRASWGAFIASCTLDRRLAAVLSAQSGNYALPPSRASVLVGAGLMLHYLAGAYFPRGGGQAISNGLAAAVEKNGGRILLRARVERILVEGGQVRGVELKSPHLGTRRVRADLVVSNADLKRTLVELVGRPSITRVTESRAEGYAMAPALGVLYLGMRRDLLAEGHPRTNYWVAPDYDSERVYAAAERGEFVDETNVLVSLNSVKDPTNRRAAPPGITNLQVVALAPADPASWGVTGEELRAGTYRRSERYRQAKARYAASLVRAAERVFPDLGRQIVFQELSTPLTQRRYTGATGGTSYGLAQTPEQSLWHRPGARTEIAGLYLCGASCRGGHGIAGVMASGVAAVAEIIGPRVLGEVFGGAEPQKEAAWTGAAS